MLQTLASTRRLGILLILWFSATVLGGCAAQPATYADEPDPWEGMNRGIFAFNRGLDKAGPIDCATIIGYLVGSLEALGTPSPRVEHEACSVLPGSQHPACVFDVTWS